MKDKYICKCIDCQKRCAENTEVFMQGIHAGIFCTVKLALNIATRIVLVIAVAVTVLAVVS